MLEKEQINPIGIGTFRIDLEKRKQSLEGLLYSFYNGQNYTSTSFVYEKGKVLEFLSEFFQQIDREKIFIASNLESNIEKEEDVEKQLDDYLRLMKLDYVDSLQIHAPSVTRIPLMDTYYEMNKLVKKGKVRYLGASNTTLEQLKQIHENFSLFNFEGVYNLECKLYEKLGVVNYCKENNIDFVCYQPLRRNRTASRNYPFLVEMAKKYNKTQNQIILNWIVKEKGLKTLIKSTEIERIKENLDSQRFVLEKEDVQKLNDFQSKEFNSVIIDWEYKGEITIDQLANQF